MQSKWICSFITHVYRLVILLGFVITLTLGASSLILAHSLNQQTQPIATVVVAGLNIRSGPGTGFGRIGGVKQGDRLVVLEQMSNCAWLHIRTSGNLEGWVSGSPQYVTLNVTCHEITVVDGQTPVAVTPTTQSPAATPTPRQVESNSAKPVPSPSGEGFDAAVQTYARAMGGDLEKVREEITLREYRDRQGKPFVVAVTANGTPLMIAVEGQGGEYQWRIIGLKDLGARVGITFGASFTLNLPGGKKLNDPRYLKVLEMNFDAITISQGMFWKWLEPQRGALDRYNLADISDQLQILQRISPKIVSGQHFVFPQTYPDWLNNGNFDGDQLIGILRERIKSLNDLTKGKISEWGVVNEPYFVTTPGHGFDFERADVLYKRIGPDYIEIAFQIAREETPPGTILLYNDTANHSSQPKNYSNGLYTQLTRQNIAPLKAKGLIDGVGMQMHIQAANPPSKADLIKTMQGYGVPIFITELDVDLSDVPGTKQERFAKQAQIYSDVLDACLQSGVCQHFSFWDVGDHISWLVLYQVVSLSFLDEHHREKETDV